MLLPWQPQVFLGGAGGTRQLKLLGRDRNLHKDLTILILAYVIETYFIN